MKRKIIPLAIASNDLYAPGVAVCLYSILEKTVAFLDIVVLDQDISNENKKLIKLSLKKFKNFNLIFLDVKKFHLERFPSILHYGTATYLRYFLPDVFLKYDKIIYTDADVIFMGDIKEYFDIDMDGKGIAATTEETGKEYHIPWNHEFRKKLFNISKKHKYFAAGNLIISCDYWRKNEITQKLVNKTIELQEKLIAPDLDVMNIIFEKNYKELPLKYCVCCHVWPDRNINTPLKKSFINPFIIHYTGPKPWNKKNVPFFKEFEDILKQTLFYEIVKKKYVNENKNKSKYYLFGFIPLIKTEKK